MYVVYHVMSVQIAAPRTKANISSFCHGNWELTDYIVVCSCTCTYDETSHFFYTLSDIRKHLTDQLGCLEFRMDSKLSLLQEYQEFFKRRGEVEYEYARSIERLCEKFERNTKQRNIRCVYHVYRIL